MTARMRMKNPSVWTVDVLDTVFCPIAGSPHVRLPRSGLAWTPYAIELFTRCESDRKGARPERGGRSTVRRGPVAPQVRRRRIGP